MKKFKQFSLAITMLFCIVSFGQEREIKINLSDSIINYKINKDFNLLQLRGNKQLNIQNDALIVIDNIISSNEQVKNINLQEIKEILILKGWNRNQLDGYKYVIIVTKLSKKEIRKLKNQLNEKN